MKLEMYSYLPGQQGVSQTLQDSQCFADANLIQKIVAPNVAQVLWFDETTVLKLQIFIQNIYNIN